MAQRLWRIAGPKGTRTEGFVGGTICLVKSTLLSAAILTPAETPELRGTLPAGEMGKNLRTSLSLLNNLSKFVQLLPCGTTGPKASSVGFHDLCAPLLRRIVEFQCLRTSISCYPFAQKREGVSDALSADPSPEAAEGSKGSSGCHSPGHLKPC